MRDQFEQSSAPSVVWMSPQEIRQAGSRRTHRNRAVASAVLAVVATGGALTLTNRDADPEEFATPPSVSGAAPTCGSDYVAGLPIKIVLHVDHTKPAWHTALIADLERLGFANVSAVSADVAAVSDNPIATIRYPDTVGGTAFYLRGLVRDQAASVTMVSTGMPDYAGPASDGRAQIDVIIGVGFTGFIAGSAAEKYVNGLGPTPYAICAEPTSSGS